MKKALILLSIVSFVFISCKEEKVKQTEIKNSTKKEIKAIPKKVTNVIVWKGYKPTGSHTGTINVKSTDFKFEGDKLIGGEVIFDMSTIKNKDIKDPNYKADLEKHLKSVDFFDIVKNPTSKFVISTVNSDKNGQVEIKGNLTLNGVTKEIKFPASIKNGTLQSKIIKINRTDFGIKFKSKTFFKNLKDKFINDEFDIAFKLNLK